MRQMGQDIHCKSRVPFLHAERETISRWISQHQDTLFRLKLETLSGLHEAHVTGDERRYKALSRGLVGMKQETLLQPVS